MSHVVTLRQLDTERATVPKQSQDEITPYDQGVTWNVTMSLAENIGESRGSAHVVAF